MMLPVCSPVLVTDPLECKLLIVISAAVSGPTDNAAPVTTPADRSQPAVIAPAVTTPVVDKLPT